MGERERDPRDGAGNGTGAPEGSRVFDSKGWLADTTGEMRDNFARNRRVISFAEYLTLFAADPARQLRSAGQYLRDVFDHFGAEAVRTPRGVMTRWRLFGSASGKSNRRRWSITGMTAPRRFITPSTKAGALGTRVSSSGRGLSTSSSL